MSIVKPPAMAYCRSKPVPKVLYFEKLFEISGFWSWCQNTYNTNNIYLYINNFWYRNIEILDVENFWKMRPMHLSVKIVPSRPLQVFGAVTRLTVYRASSNIEFPSDPTLQVDCGTFNIITLNPWILLTSKWKSHLEN